MCDLTCILNHMRSDGDAGAGGQPQPQRQQAPTRAVRVFCRFRPMSPSEARRRERSIVQLSTCGTKVVLRSPASGGGSRQFEFDHVFHPTATQAAVYRRVGDPVVQAGIRVAVQYTREKQKSAGRSFPRSAPPL